MENYSKPVRVRRSEAEIRALLEEQASSNIKVNEFCSARQISRALFYSWRSKYNPIIKEPVFMPVQLMDDGQVQSIFAEVEFPRQVSIRFFRHVDPAYLKSTFIAMIHLSDKYRYLIYSGNTDMRKSFHGLAAIVKYHMNCNVLNGDIYIFFSRRRNAIKLLRFEGDGFAIFTSIWRKVLLKCLFIISRQGLSL